MIVEDIGVFGAAASNTESAAVVDDRVAKPAVVIEADCRRGCQIVDRGAIGRRSPLKGHITVVAVVDDGIRRRRAPRKGQDEIIVEGNDAAAVIDDADTVEEQGSRKGHVVRVDRCPRAERPALHDDDAIN